MKPQVHSEPEREDLSGLVERVTFHSPDNGSCVLRVKIRGYRDLFTVIGSAATVQAGEYIHASGHWENNLDHDVRDDGNEPTIHYFHRQADPASISDYVTLDGRGRAWPHFSQGLAQ